MSGPSIALVLEGVPAWHLGCCTINIIVHNIYTLIAENAGSYYIQTCLAMDALAQSLMKGAANCNMHSDLQNSVKHLEIECGMCF